VASNKFKGLCEAFNSAAEVKLARPPAPPVYGPPRLPDMAPSVRASCSMKWP